ncbi:MAG: roadblock/LC7 domain-containing protein [Deltaproteobacteria bacterium]|nr:roadblock/LC7 domain-containing protein [Deltaproteobacteria bacterium]
MTIPRRFVPQRDLRGTAFTAALRGLVEDVPGLQAAAFCDEEGEVVDYHTYLAPYETKVAGAVLGLLLATVQREAPHLAAGGIRELVVLTDQHVLFVRRSVADYFVAGVMDPGGALGKLLAALDAAEARLLTEAGL